MRMTFKLFDYRPPRHDWRAAWRAAGLLTEDPRRTVEVFNVTHALQGNAILDCYLKLLSSQNGADLTREPELWRQMDEWTDRHTYPFRTDTFGYAYQKFVARTGLRNGVLQEISFGSRGGAELKADHPLSWTARRTTAVHDLCHVLCGYGEDVLGELCVLAFTYEQLGLLGNVAIALGGLSLKPPGGLRAVHEAWKNGRRAVWLLGLDFADLVHRPLDEVRASLRIDLPKRYVRWNPSPHAFAH